VQVFVDVMSDEEYQLSETHPVNLDDTRLWGIIDRLANVITINVALPPGALSLQVLRFTRDRFRTVSVERNLFTANNQTLCGVR